MVQPRIEMNATMLPNGKILTSGGSQIDEDGTTASLKAELYDPTVGTIGAFTSAGSNTYPASIIPTPSYCLTRPCSWLAAILIREPTIRTWKFTRLPICSIRTELWRHGRPLQT